MGRMFSTPGIGKRVLGAMGIPWCFANPLMAFLLPALFAMTFLLAAHIH